MASKKQNRRKADRRSRSAPTRAPRLEPKPAPSLKPAATADAASIPAPSGRIPQPAAPWLRRPSWSLEGARSLVQSRASPYAPLAVIFGLSFLVSALWAAQHSPPQLLPDEMSYGKIPQNFADGNGRVWRHWSHALPPLW